MTTEDETEAQDIDHFQKFKNSSVIENDVHPEMISRHRKDAEFAKDCFVNNDTWRTWLSTMRGKRGNMDSG
jgi:hypothetical protein